MSRSPELSTAGRLRGGSPVAACAAVILGLACAPDVVPDEPEQPTPAPPAVFPDVIGGARPAEVWGPDGWAQVESLPLVVLLHGFSANGELQNLLFGYSETIAELPFVLVLPDGTENTEGLQFWNATPACCDFENSGVDDVGYLLSLLDEAEERWNIDPSRIYFSGHSNGGFMSYRMACEAPERIAGIAGLAGATFADEASCDPAARTHVLHMHGALDEDVLYGGSDDPGRPVPGARESAERWAARAGCGEAEPVVGEALDLWSNLGSPDTEVLGWRACSSGRDVDLWTMPEGGHIPIPDDAFAPTVLRWLFERPHPDR